MSKIGPLWGTLPLLRKNSKMSNFRTQKNHWDYWGLWAKPILNWNLDYFLSYKNLKSWCKWVRRCFWYIQKWPLLGNLLTNFQKVPIFWLFFNTFTPHYPIFFNFYMMKYVLNFILKLILLPGLKGPNVVFASENCQFYWFFRATVRYLKVIQSFS